MINPFQNLIINLHAVGHAAVVCVWLVCTAMVAVFGSGPIAESGMRILAIAGGALITVMSFAK